MAVKQLPTLSPIPEPPNRLVGDQERFDTMTFNSLKAQEKMVNVDLNQNVIPALNQFAVDVNASVDAAKASETSALASKNSAASSAGTATTKAGEAAASAKAAKTSETSALASKNAASSSATAAANAQKAAEAARDEAQDLANVGYASESRAGLAKVDGKTTQAAADGAITVKDVAIGGDLGDLASARGQIGDNIRINTASDLNAYTKAGNWLFSDAAAGENFPNIGRGGELNCYVSTTAIFQFFTEFNNNRRYIRYGIPNSTWTNWIQFISVAQLGDGIRNTNGIISVPEYEGATVSTAGTSGLVPPAAAGQHESFLTGGGEYKPALTKISDSVNLADSKTAASAKAVKTAYDLAADAKQKSNTSGTADYANGLRGIPLQWVGRGASPEFLLGRLGQEPFDAFRPMHIEGVGSAKAWKAQNSGGNYVLYDEILGENPTYIMGYALNGIFKIYTTSALSVNYANSAGSAPANGGTSWATAVMPNVAFVGRDGAIPNGGTWLYIYMPYDSHYLRGVTLAGGATAPSNDGGIAIRVA